MIVGVSESSHLCEHYSDSNFVWALVGFQRLLKSECDQWRSRDCVIMELSPLRKFVMATGVEIQLVSRNASITHVRY